MADDGVSLGSLVGESVGLVLGASEKLCLTLGRWEGAPIRLSVADDGESLGLLVSPLFGESVVLLLGVSEELGLTLGRSRNWTVSGRCWTVIRITGKSLCWRVSRFTARCPGRTWVDTRLIQRGCIWTVSGR